MLSIRPEQVAVLEQYMMKQFEERMRVHLRRIFPKDIKTISEKALQNQIERCTAKAIHQYKITTEGDVQRYLESAVLYGWNFDTQPETHWAGEILGREDLDGEAKMDKIEQHSLNHKRGN
jgi:hypothetical protein